eukprot:1158096-Pelagomonas_calceolata.AAC.8
MVYSILYTVDMSGMRSVDHKHLVALDIYVDWPRMPLVGGIPWRPGLRAYNISRLSHISAVTTVLA